VSEDWHREGSVLTHSRTHYNFADNPQLTPWPIVINALNHRTAQL
jgi:hypothetical protein